MKKAILHIGTEKTGTTSIQKFLFQNRDRLQTVHTLFPRSGGFISNQRLVVYGKQAPEPDLAEPGLDVNDPVALAQWKDRFVEEHCAEVLAFQASHPADSTLIYSAEHLQSRLTRVDEISRIARLLRPMFDEIRVVVYLRRQDKYALSAHSTSVRGGNRNTFAFEDINAAGPYYNYRELLENWSEVFGQDALTVRLFERSRMQEGDVVSDFCDLAGLDISRAGYVIPEPENEALSHTALTLLRRFNALDANDPRLQGMDKQTLRPLLLEQVQSIADDFGRILPSRQSAQAFQERFAEANEWIADTWLGGQGFDSSFAEYPETPTQVPTVDGVDERLDELIGHCARVEKGIAGRIFSVARSSLARTG